jgi:DNA polymerase I-like protein with 3'-5' exonuclease and polymerase domains
MESLKDTIIVEWNGMYVNMNELAAGADELNRRLRDVEEGLKVIEPNINWNSPKQLQAFFFGGNVITGTADVPTGEFYKTGSKKGLAKTKKMSVGTNFVGIINPFAPFLGDYSTDTSEENLKEIAIKLAKSVGTHKVLSIISMLLNYRKLTKDFKTYYVGIAKLVWPNDSCVHGSFNHTATDTGRLSCHSPNLQNITSLE